MLRRYYHNHTGYRHSTMPSPTRAASTSWGTSPSRSSARRLRTTAIAVGAVLGTHAAVGLACANERHQRRRGTRRCHTMHRRRSTPRPRHAGWHGPSAMRVCAHGCLAPFFPSATPETRRRSDRSFCPVVLPFLAALARRWPPDRWAAQGLGLPRRGGRRARARRRGRPRWPPSPPTDALPRRGRGPAIQGIQSA